MNRAMLAIFLAVITHNLRRRSPQKTFLKIYTYIYKIIMDRDVDFGASKHMSAATLCFWP